MALDLIWSIVRTPHRGRPAAKVNEKTAVDRLAALLSCVDSVRRGRTVSISGVYGGHLDLKP